MRAVDQPLPYTARPFAPGGRVQFGQHDPGTELRIEGVIRCGDGAKALGEFRMRGLKRRNLLKCNGLFRTVIRTSDSPQQVEQMLLQVLARNRDSRRGPLDDGGQML